MEALSEMIERIMQALPYRIVISRPVGKDAVYQRIVVEKKDTFYQAAAYTQKQVFHRNFPLEEAAACLAQTMAGVYRELHAWDGVKEYAILVSKKGKATYLEKRGGPMPGAQPAHNRKKKYLIEEGTAVPPLVDMGIFTPSGKVVASMYDKFRQINRFLEMIEDSVEDEPDRCLHVIDFGCGKSYLTFVLYYYFTELKGRDVRMVGLDLKEDVIENCNVAAEKYGYRNLHFEVGDINGYQAAFPVDLVVTLHACDTATDYALFNAVVWNARMIFSVPCCQHELNSQAETENFSLLTRYGIVKERFCALATDAIRANLLECCGYRTQLLEFVDFSHTPKNILIRAVKRGGAAPAKAVVPLSVKRKYLEEVERLTEEFHFRPTLYELLKESGRL